MEIREPACSTGCHREKPVLNARRSRSRSPIPWRLSRNVLRLITRRHAWGVVEQPGTRGCDHGFWLDSFAERACVGAPSAGSCSGSEWSRVAGSGIAVCAWRSAGWHHVAVTADSRRHAGRLVRHWADARVRVVVAVRDGYVSGGTRRNFDWVKPHRRASVGEPELLLLADAQTSGAS